MSFAGRQKVDMKFGGTQSVGAIRELPLPILFLTTEPKTSPKGTLAAILRDLGFTKEDLDKV